MCVTSSVVLVRVGEVGRVRRVPPEVSPLQPDDDVRLEDVLGRQHVEGVVEDAAG